MTEPDFVIITGVLGDIASFRKNGARKGDRYVRRDDHLAAIEAARVEARAKALEEAADVVYEMGGSGWDCATIAEKLRSLAKEAPHG